MSTLSELERDQRGGHLVLILFGVMCCIDANVVAAEAVLLNRWRRS
jgi:hypothetical protein